MHTSIYNRIAPNHLHNQPKSTNDAGAIVHGSLERWGTVPIPLRRLDSRRHNASGATLARVHDELKNSGDHHKDLVGEPVVSWRIHVLILHSLLRAAQACWRPMRLV